MIGLDGSAVLAAAAAAQAKLAAEAKALAEAAEQGKAPPEGPPAGRGNAGKSTLVGAKPPPLNPGGAAAIPLDRTMVQADVAAADELDAVLGQREDPARAEAAAAERIAAEEAVARAVEMHQPSSPELPALPRATILQPLALTNSGTIPAVAPEPAPEPEPKPAVQAKPSAETKPSLKSTAQGVGGPEVAANAKASLKSTAQGVGTPEAQPNAKASMKSTAVGMGTRPLAAAAAPAGATGGEQAEPGATAPGVGPQPVAANPGKPRPAQTLVGLSPEAAQALAQVQPPERRTPTPGRRDSLPLGIAPPPSGAPPAGAEPPRPTSAKHTMLGMQMAALPPQASDAASRSSQPAAAGAFGATAQPAFKGGLGRTMLGVPVASISPPAAATSVSPSQPPPVYEPAQSRAASEPTQPLETQAPGRTRMLIVIAVLTLAALVGLAYLRWGGKGKTADVAARIITSESGESLQFDAPRAAPGSRLRFGGQERPLVDGRATFALAADSLRAGDNVVLADVIGPSGETASTRIVLAVFYRIAVDTAALRSERPSIDVVVTAVPGTKVTLEGEPLALDDSGKGKRNFPLEPSQPGKGAIEHVVHYRMEPSKGDAVTDELHTRIPVAMIQIDRPGPELVTDQESVEIAGVVGRDTRVNVDGTLVPVREAGRFSHRLQLPRTGEFKPRVIASAPGKAPVAVTLSIRRVRDLAQAARDFSFDKSLTYAKIAANPTSFRGQAIAIEGQVYAADARAGSSVIQMLARPCPSAQRCSLWVVDPQAGEVGLNKWVRVLGVVDGEQQFRSEKQEIVTVPKIIARFVLPAKP